MWIHRVVVTLSFLLFSQPRRREEKKFTFFDIRCGTGPQDGLPLLVVWLGLCGNLCNVRRFQENRGKSLLLISNFQIIIIYGFPIPVSLLVWLHCSSFLRKIEAAWCWWCRENWLTGPGGLTCASCVALNSELCTRVCRSGKQRSETFRHHQVRFVCMYVGMATRVGL